MVGRADLGDPDAHGLDGAVELDGAAALPRLGAGAHPQDLRPQRGVGAGHGRGWGASGAPRALKGAVVALSVCLLGACVSVDCPAEAVVDEAPSLLQPRQEFALCPGDVRLFRGDASTAGVRVDPRWGMAMQVLVLELDGFKEVERHHGVYELELHGPCGVRPVAPTDANYEWLQLSMPEDASAAAVRVCVISRVCDPVCVRVARAPCCSSRSANHRPHE